MTLVDLLVWTDVCGFDQLTPGRGVAALVQGRQVALFRLADDSLYALSNFDPFSQAYVLSRGIVGSKGDVPKVAAPIFKQNFDLRTGQCLDDPSVSVASFPVRIVDGRVEIGSS
jgi:nitrite reductase (NADH) small subunit